MHTTFDGPALELTNVVKTYGLIRAVDNLSLTVPQGEVLAVLGPNGAGKTTTIEMCEGFITPTSGNIRVFGLDPTRQPDQVRACTGIMLQGGGSYNGATVMEMLRLSAAYNQSPHDPDWLVQILGLEGVRKNTYRRLSGGQRQRLSLALALISRPLLVFLDEPTAGLDAQSRNLVWSIITALRRDGVAVVLSTHMMDEAESLADQVVIIDRGSVVAQGSPQELTRGAAGAPEEIRCEVDRDFDLDTLHASYPELSTLSRSRPLHYRLAACTSPALIAQLAQAAEQQNITIRSLTVTHRTLEDVFLDITGRELRS